MVRAPCCEKMGLKKGPWTQDEDHILINHIQRFGHGNWRALPKQAGLLRCGKSCRLRWINYLRPDIKRGNFSREEDATIINLHEMLGNRWSAIASKLPGRTDNEIKNYWHTHLKKRLNDKNQTPNIRIRAKRMTQKFDSRPVSPEQSVSDFSLITETSGFSSDNNSFTKEESFSSEEIPIIDESFWSDDNVAADAALSDTPSDSLMNEPIDLLDSSNGDSIDFWLRVFMGAGEMNDLPLV